MSSSEAVFVAAWAMVQEVMYFRRLLASLGFPQEGPTSIFEDNQTCRAWSTGMVGGTDKSKHMDLRAQRAEAGLSQALRHHLRSALSNLRRWLTVAG